MDLETQIAFIIQKVLQREPLDGEVESYVALVNSSSLTVDEICQGIVNGNESETYVVPVILAYQAVYGRVPDETGLDYWTDIYRDLVDSNIDDPETPTINEAMVALLDAFVDPVQTPEFAERYGTNPTGDQFVTFCYINVLNRDPADDEEGLSYWQHRYQSLKGEIAAREGNEGLTEAEINQITRQEILEQFVSSDEYAEAADRYVDQFLKDAAEGTEEYTGSLWDQIAPYVLLAGDITVVEGDSGQKQAFITIEIDHPAEQDLVINVSTLGTGTATASDDYVPLQQTVTILAGQTTALLPVTVLGDTKAELNETIDVQFTSDLIESTVVATVTIADDDPIRIALTPQTDLFVGPNSGGPANETFIAGEDDLNTTDEIDGDEGEDTLFLAINRGYEDIGSGGSFSVPVTGATDTFTLFDDKDLNSSANQLIDVAAGPLWDGFSTEDVEVLAIQNNDSQLWGSGYASYSGSSVSLSGQFAQGHLWGGSGFEEVWGSADYGSTSGGLQVGSGGIAIVDASEMDDALQTVVFFQQNGNTMVRDLQASHLAHDGVHFALLDVEGYHGSSGSGGGSGYSLYEDDNPFTCCDEDGLPRQVAMAVDTFIDWDIEATRGVNIVNAVMSEVEMSNLWLTQNLDNEEGELAEIEQLNIDIPAETELLGAEFDGISGEPVLINRIWASSTLATVTVTGDDVTELVGGVPDDEFDLMLGIPILATPFSYASGSSTGLPWGLDGGLQGLTTFDSSAFLGDVFLALYEAVGMDIDFGVGDDDLFINAAAMSSGGPIGQYTFDNGLLQDTSIDGGDGMDVLWLPMGGYGEDGGGEYFEDPYYEYLYYGYSGFDAIGSGNTIVNVEKICFYGAIGSGSSVYELEIDDLGIVDPETTELVFDGSVGASLVILDDFDQILNVKFTELGGYYQYDNESAINDYRNEAPYNLDADYVPSYRYGPVLAFVPATETDNDVVNVTFSDDTLYSSYITITDDDKNFDEEVLNDKFTPNNESDDELDGDFTDDVDAEVDILNIHLEDSLNCGIADCIHIGFDSMTDLTTVTVTDDDYEHVVTPELYEFFQSFSSVSLVGAMQALSSSAYYELMKLYTSDELGNGRMLPEDYQDLQIGDTFVSKQSAAFGVVYNDGNDTPDLAHFDASESHANIDLWLNNSIRGDGYVANGYEDTEGYGPYSKGPALYQLEFDSNGALIQTGTGNDRVSDGSGDDVIETDGGCDLVIASTGDDMIYSGDGMDLVVGGEGDDYIEGGDGNDILSGDGFGWILALLGDECADIDCSTAAALLDFFCCIYDPCFKDDWAPEWELILISDEPNGSTSDLELKDLYCVPEYGFEDYFLDQVDGDEEELETTYPVILDLCDIADAIRTGSLDITPFSGSIVLDFDWDNEIVQDFVLTVLSDVIESLGLDQLVGSPGSTLQEILDEIYVNDYTSPIDPIDFDSGDDVIFGGAGDDIIHGGSGEDALYGEDGEDIVVGGDNDVNIAITGDTVVPEIIDGGADADRMVGGSWFSVSLLDDEDDADDDDGWYIPDYLGQTGVPAIPAEAIIFAEGLHGDGDDYVITIFGMTTENYTATLDDGETIYDVLEELANMIDADSGTTGVSAFFNGTEIELTGDADGTDFGISVNAFDQLLNDNGTDTDPTDDTGVDFYTRAEGTVTIDEDDVYYDGDEITISATIDGDSYSVTYTASQGDTADDVAQALYDLMVDNVSDGAGLFDDQFIITLDGNEITLAAQDTSVAFSVSTSLSAATVTDLYEVMVSGLDAIGEDVQVSIDIDGPGGPASAISWSQSVTALPTTTASVLDAFVAEHELDILDILDDGVDNGSDGASTGDAVYVHDGKLYLYDEGDTIGGGGGTFAASFGGTGSASIFEVGGPDPTSASTSTTNDAPDFTPENGADADPDNTATYTPNDDNTQGLDYEYTEGDPGIPYGTDGSDLFVVQTGQSPEVSEGGTARPEGTPDGVQATTEYGFYDGLENEIDYICDFWSLLSPAVTGNTGNVALDPEGDNAHNRAWYEYWNSDVGPQVADQIAFKTYDGTALAFGATGLNYAEHHNGASNYWDALFTANSDMANGQTKYVAVSYNQGAADNGDMVFDDNENFLVVFADTDDDNIADTAVRLLGRDNVNHDINWEDIVALNEYGLA